jgi:hypothetical protein
MMGEQQGQYVPSFISEQRRALDLYEFMRLYVKPIDGVAEVRILPRGAEQCPKVYVVLDTHDVRRDERIVAILSQIQEVDYDLVPRVAIGMIPDGTREV